MTFRLPLRLPILPLALLALLALLACEGNHPTATLPPPPPEEEEPDSVPRALGLLEVTLTGPSAGPQAVPSKPVNQDGSGGSIQLEFLSNGTFTRGTRGAGGERYLWATFKVRNAESDGTPYDTERKNLTFVAVATSSTLGDTPIKVMDRFDGSAADPSIAPDFRPTGAVETDERGDLQSIHPDVLQAFTEAEVDAIPLSGSITDIYPYGFMTRNAGDPTSRVLPANPAEGVFDGLVTFAYRFPLQADKFEDPFSVSIVVLILDDPDTRITRSIEEETSEGLSAFVSRADAVGASEVRLLGSAAYVGTIPEQRLCPLRVAGEGAGAANLSDTCDEPPDVVSVAVTPSSPEVPLDGTMELTATPKDLGGGDLADRVVTWSSSRPGVATVSETGVVTGVGAGYTTITATSEGVTGSANLTVSPPAWELVEDFSTYLSTTELAADPDDVFHNGLDRNISNVHLDTGVGVGEIGTTQSMRYDWPSGAGKDYELGRVVKLPTTTSELWVEVWLRFSESFTTEGPETGNPDYKTFFANVLPDGVGRWEFKVAEGSLHGIVVGEHTNTTQQFPTADTCTADPTACERATSEQDDPGNGKYWDGQWYRYRVHFRMESADGANDGAIQMWIKPEGGTEFQYVDESGLDTGNASHHFGLLYLGSNMNKGTSRTMSAWWGRVTARNRDPGW